MRWRGKASSDLERFTRSFPKRSHMIRILYVYCLVFKSLFSAFDTYHNAMKHFHFVKDAFLPQVWPTYMYDRYEGVTTDNQCATYCSLRRPACQLFYRTGTTCFIGRMNTRNTLLGTTTTDGLWIRNGNGKIHSNGVKV